MTRTSVKRSAAGAESQNSAEQQQKLRKQDKGQGIVRDDRGQEQPADKRRAQQNDGLRAQEDAAAQKDIPSPGEPARGE